eukprot:UN22228
MKLGLLLLLLLPIVYSQSDCVESPSVNINLEDGEIVGQQNMSQPGGELRIRNVGTYDGRNINIRMTQTSTRNISDGNLTATGFMAVLSSDALTSTQWVNFKVELIDDNDQPVVLPVMYWSIFDLEGPADKKEAVRLRNDQVSEFYRNGLQEINDGEYRIFRATAAGTVSNPTDPHNLTAAQKSASVGFKVENRSFFMFGYQNVNSPRSCFLYASTDEVVGTFCPVCSAYGYEDGVTDGNPNSCVDNETELDAGDSCYIKCKEGYTQSGFGDVLCPTNATDGQAPLVDITCTDTNDCAPNPCLNGGNCTDKLNGFTCSCQPGWSGDICDENIDDCEPTNWCVNGVCVDGLDDYSCDCNDGWTGEFCQTAIANCSDGIQNQDETGVDCGGVCPTACETCTDGIQNQNEGGVDCGGVCPTACETCTDGIQNQNEEAVDCGGVCPADCACTCPAILDPDR